MRSHRVFPQLQPWAGRSELLRELAVAGNLTAVRIEPVTRGREVTAFVDLRFSDGARSIAIPLIYLDLAQLDIRESDPLIFPHHVAASVSDANVRDIVERIYPELEKRAFRDGFRAEEVIAFAPDATFERARELGLFGAAPLGVTLPRIAAAVYARRFAFGKRVATYGERAIEIAALLDGAGAISTVTAGPAGADAAALEAWYGAVPAGEAPDGKYDVLAGSGPAPDAGAAVWVRLDAGGAGVPVGILAPLPADLMLSFSGGAPAFTVAAAVEPMAREATGVVPLPAVGGSGGRVAVAVRADAALVPDNDTDEAASLAAALRREGFTVEVVSDLDALETFGPDLVHLFGVRPGGYARRVAEWAAAHRKPLAVHAFFESPDQGGYWGAMVAPYCFAYSGDDRSVRTYLDLLARRSVEVDGVKANMAWAPPEAGLADAQRVLAMADVVLVNSKRELAVVEPLRKGRPALVVPPLPVPLAVPVPIGARVGSDPFVLMHAPIGPEFNQLLLARAARAGGAPLVIAGPVADPVYAERLREFAPLRSMLLDEPAPGEVAALYRAAAVVVDASWTGRGHGRLATAAAFEAAIVKGAGNWIDLPSTGVWTVDVADAGSIERGVGEALDAALRRDPALQTVAAFTAERSGTAAAAILAAYAKIAQEVSGI
jgi:hypothetical protein